MFATNSARIISMPKCVHHFFEFFVPILVSRLSLYKKIIDLIPNSDWINVLITIYHEFDFYLFTAINGISKKTINVLCLCESEKKTQH